MGHGKAPFHSGHSRSSYYPFKNFCIFLNCEALEAIIADRNYLRNRLDELEFSMYIANCQTMKLQERIRELEDNKFNHNTNGKAERLKSRQSDDGNNG